MNDGTTSLIQREKSGAAFSRLIRWLSGWKNSEVIFSHATKQFVRLVITHFHVSNISEFSRGFSTMPVSFRVNGLSCLFVCFLNVIFRFYFVHYYYSNMHACKLFFKISHSSFHSFIVHSLYHLSTFLCNLPAGHSKNKAVARFAEDRFTERVIFSSKITFLYHPCFSIFRIINSTILHGNQYYLQHLHRFLASAPEVGEDSSWFLC